MHFEERADFGAGQVVGGYVHRVINSVSYIEQSSKSGQSRCHKHYKPIGALG
jgi:hypothetical protein